MPFLEISDDQFDPVTDFVVKESTGMNLLIGVFFLLFAFLSISMSWWMCFLFALPGIGAVLQGLRHNTVMIVNKNGFYYYGEFVTNWTDFIGVEFQDEVPIPSGYSAGITDRFSMRLKYHKDGERGRYHIKTIRFTDTQDKSEEEIIAAIKFYHRQHGGQYGMNAAPPHRND